MRPIIGLSVSPYGSNIRGQQLNQHSRTAYVGRKMTQETPEASEGNDSGDVLDTAFHNFAVQTGLGAPGDKIKPASDGEYYTLGKKANSNSNAESNNEQPIQEEPKQGWRLW